MKYNLVFFGSPEFSAIILRHLATLPYLNIRAVVTNPDTPQGREKTITPTPVAVLSQSLHLPIFKPPILDDKNLSHLKLFKPDLFFVVAYGKIIPNSYLAAPSIATLNVHYSLLPRYRGALCVKQAILNQDESTGVTLMEMDQLLDHGPIIAQHRLQLGPDHNVSSLTQALTDLSIAHLDQDLTQYLQFKADGLTNSSPNLYLPPKPQDESQATYTPKTNTNTKATAFLPPKQLIEATQGKNARQTLAFIQAHTPQPVAWTKFKTGPSETSLNILKAHLEADSLILDLVQIPGKNPISFTQFAQGHPLTP